MLSRGARLSHLALGSPAPTLALAFCRARTIYTARGGNGRRPEGAEDKACQNGAANGRRRQSGGMRRGREDAGERDWTLGSRHAANGSRPKLDGLRGQPSGKTVKPRSGRLDPFGIEEDDGDDVDASLDKKPRWRNDSIKRGDNVTSRSFKKHAGKRRQEPLDDNDDELQPGELVDPEEAKPPVPIWARKRAAREAKASEQALKAEEGEVDEAEKDDGNDMLNRGVVMGASVTKATWAYGEQGGMAALIARTPLEPLSLEDLAELDRRVATMDMFDKAADGDAGAEIDAALRSAEDQSRAALFVMDLPRLVEILRHGTSPTSDIGMGPKGIWKHDGGLREERIIGRVQGLHRLLRAALGEGGLDVVHYNLLLFHLLKDHVDDRRISFRPPDFFYGISAVLRKAADDLIADMTAHAIPFDGVTYSLQILLRSRNPTALHAIWTHCRTNKVPLQLFAYTTLLRGLAAPDIARRAAPEYIHGGPVVSHQPFTSPLPADRLAPPPPPRLTKSLLNSLTTAMRKHAHLDPFAHLPYIEAATDAAVALGPTARDMVNRLAVRFAQLTSPKNESSRGLRWRASTYECALRLHAETGGEAADPDDDAEKSKKGSGLGKVGAGGPGAFRRLRDRMKAAAEVEGPWKFKMTLGCVEGLMRYHCYRGRPAAALGVWQRGSSGKAGARRGDHAIYGWIMECGVMMFEEGEGRVLAAGRMGTLGGAAGIKVEAIEEGGELERQVAEQEEARMRAKEANALATVTQTVRAMLLRNVEEPLAGQLIECEKDVGPGTWDLLIASYARLGMDADAIRCAERIKTEFAPRWRARGAYGFSETDGAGDVVFGRVALKAMMRLLGQRCGRDGCGELASELRELVSENAMEAYWAAWWSEGNDQPALYKDIEVQSTPDAKEAEAGFGPLNDLYEALLKGWQEGGAKDEEVLVEALRSIRAAEAHVLKEMRRRRPEVDVNVVRKIAKDGVEDTVSL
ncbi:hypothetical protein HK101_011384 [Irineochytrium annulatum]|nr:hypothetical protein HK101_011384 [Irineochytrium annulatum]